MPKPATPRTGGSGRWWRLALVAVLLAGCAACSSRSAPHAAKDLALVASCPTDTGVPIPGIPATVLPCMTDPDVRVSAAALHGRPEVINLWASWCAPCQREARVLQDAHQAAGDSVLFLGVDTHDTPGAARSFLAEHGVTYPQVVDEAGTLASGLGVRGLPYTLVVDGTGQVVDRVIGELTAGRLRMALDRLDAAPR